MFVVGANGGLPLSYQWSFNGTNIAGATSASLTLSNVQFNQAGNYAVVVSNALGSAISSNALLTVVFPTAIVRAVNTSGLAGSTVAVPVQLTANGNENALGFSLAYDTNLLAFSDVALGSGATGAALISNTSQTNSGKVGVALALSSGSTFAPGIRELVQVYFNIIAAPASSNRTTGIIFGDQPTGRQLSDVTAANLAATYVNGVINITNPPPPCASVTANLVSWWRGEGDALDFAGGNNGTLFGGMGFAAGKVGQAFSFDGVDDEVRFGTTVGNFGTNDFTIEFWLKTTANNSWVSVLEKWPLCGHSSKFNIRINSGRMHAEVEGNTSGANFFSILGNRYVNDGVYHHMALVRTPTNLSLFVDGTLDVSAITPGIANISNSVNLVAGRSACVGADGTVRFTGQLDEIAIYQRALVANELQAIYSAQVSGKCAVPIAPYITSQPTSRTVLVGANTTFSVAAGGSPTLLYQWSANGTNIAGATNTSLTLTNVQFNQAGNYAVTVTNGGGFATSSNALLSVTFPPAVVRVVNASGMAGAIVAVPVQLLANGNENALGFSLTYNTNLLAFSNVVLGSGAPSAALIPNTSQTNSGKVGVALALNSGSVFAAGTQEVALVNFTIVAAPSASVQTASVTFGDQPTTRQLSDAAAGNLAAYYTNGIITIPASDWEGDTAPRTNGNKQLTITDWVQVGRFVAKLDVPNDGSEYQRADCAPRSTLGNGILSITDWVQAGRYAAGLDPLTMAGGPTTEDTNGVPFVGLSRFKLNGAGRTVRVVNQTVQASVTNTVTVQLDALGNENAVGFSLSFSPALLQFVGATLGADASGALLNLNTDALGSGKLGVAMALSTGVSLPAGTREILKVSFAVAPSATGTSNVAFASNPIATEISDVAANTLTATYASGLLNISPYPPVLRVNLAGTNPLVAWPVVASNFVLQVNADPAISSSNWNNAAENPALIGEEKVVTITNGSEDTKFFRLYKP